MVSWTSIFFSHRNHFRISSDKYEKLWFNFYKKSLFFTLRSYSFSYARIPKQFKFKAGDYIKIKIPVICSTEYHPFTISCAPEKEDEIWVHIRKSGDWTNKLYNHFKTISARQNRAFNLLVLFLFFYRSTFNLIFY